MNVSDQVDALQKRVAELKSSFDQARRETNEQVKARIDQVKADIAARQDAAKEKAEQAADRTQSQWKSLKADAAADALDYASWAVDQAQLAVLDAIDARSWADARAAASPSA